VSKFYNCSECGDAVFWNDECDCFTLPKPPAQPALDVKFKTLNEVECEHIEKVLAHFYSIHHNNNREKAAHALGISRATFYKRISLYGLDKKYPSHRGRPKK